MGYPAKTQIDAIRKQVIAAAIEKASGKTYAAEPDVLIEQLRADAAVMSADTLMLTIPVALGVDFNLHVLEAFASHVAPALGWNPANQPAVQRV